MDRPRYLSVMKRRWRFLLASILLLELVAASSVLVATPVYSSRVEMFVSTPQRGSGQAYGVGLFSAQRVASYARLAKSERLAAEVVRQLGLPITPADLADRVTARVAQGTVILDLSVTDEDPRRAQSIATTLAEKLAATVTRLETAPSRSTALVKLAVVDPASAPTDPVSPRLWRNAGLALAVGLVLGLGGAFLRERSDSVVRDAADVREVTLLPTLGHIFSSSVLPHKSLPAPVNALGPRGEAFRILRSRLRFADVGLEGHVVTVTSPHRADGKSTVACCLASALTEGGHRVIVIDADLRRGELGTGVGLEPGGGLAAVLTDGVRLGEAVRTTSVPNLAVLPSGAPASNPSELLQSAAMAELLKEASETYTMVILDSPPVLAVADASLLAARSDFALLVLDHGRTTADQLRGAVAQLDASGAKIAGVVLNRVPARRGSGIAGADHDA